MKPEWNQNGKVDAYVFQQNLSCNCPCSQQEMPLCWSPQETTQQNALSIPENSNHALHTEDGIIDPKEKIDGMGQKIQK